MQAKGEKTSSTDKNSTTGQVRISHQLQQVKKTLSTGKKGTKEPHNNILHT